MSDATHMTTIKNLVVESGSRSLIEPVPGQLLYDVSDDTLYYGKAQDMETPSWDTIGGGISSIGGEDGDITLGNGLEISNGVMSVYINAQNGLGFSGSGRLGMSTATTTTNGAMTSGEKVKLGGVESGAQVNVIEGLQISGNAVTPVGKIVSIETNTEYDATTNKIATMTDVLNHVSEWMDGTAIHFYKGSYTDAQLLALCSINGNVVFDSATDRIYCGTQTVSETTLPRIFGSNVQDAEWDSTTQTLTVSGIDGSSFSLCLDDSPTASTSILRNIRQDINTNTASISALSQSISQTVSGAISALDGSATLAVQNADGSVTLCSGISETDGVVSAQSGSITLSAVSTTGSANSLSVSYGSISNAQDAFDSIRSDISALQQNATEYIIPNSNATCPSGYRHYYSSSRYYTGSLRASASTINKIYLCKNSSYTGDYSQIVTTKAGSTYSWTNISTSAINLDGYVQTLTQNGATYAVTSGTTVIALPNVVNAISGEQAVPQGNTDYVKVSVSSETEGGIARAAISSTAKVVSLANATQANNGLPTAYDIKATLESGYLTVIRSWSMEDIENE